MGQNQLEMYGPMAGHMIDVVMKALGGTLMLTHGGMKTLQDVEKAFKITYSRYVCLHLKLFHRHANLTRLFFSTVDDDGDDNAKLLQKVPFLSPELLGLVDWLFHKAANGSKSTYETAVTATVRQVFDDHLSFFYAADSQSSAGLLPSSPAATSC